MIKVSILKEDGYDEAMLGLSLSYNQPISKMPRVSHRIYQRNDGSNKFLESIVVWIDIDAPRLWWQQFDEYRVGMTKQSESTMHTILKQPLRQEHFVRAIDPTTLNRLNTLLKNKNLEQLKTELPEGFLQRRIVCTNYRVVRRIIFQRMRENMQDWKQFCIEMFTQLQHQEFLEDLKEEWDKKYKPKYKV